MELKGKIVFASGKEGDYDIFSLDLGSGEVRQLTSGKHWNDCPKWSPDGQKIVFVSNRTGTPEIWVMKADGTEQRAVTAKGKWHNTPDWSPDGQRIVFCANYTGDNDIFTMKADGTDLRQLTDYPQADYAPQYSPDGAKIVFTSKRSGNDDVWTCDVKTGDLRQITRHPERDFSPTYSPDGEKIAFVAGLIGKDGRENLEIFLMDAAGESERRLTTNLGLERYVAWSPDGRYLIHTSAEFASGSERLKITDLSTGKGKSVDFERKVVESEVGAQAKATMLFQLLPQEILRKMYPETYFGKERYPDWTT